MVKNEEISLIQQHNYKKEIQTAKTKTSRPVLRKNSISKKTTNQPNEEAQNNSQHRNLAQSQQPQLSARAQFEQRIYDLIDREKYEIKLSINKK